MEQAGSSRPDGRSRSKGLLARFARSRKGVAAIEFGMVGIPFLGLLCAIIETAFVFFTQEAFDNTVVNAGRQILVGNVSATSPAAFKTSTFCPALPSFIDCSKVTLYIQSYDPTSAAFSTAVGSMNNSWYNSAPATVSLGSTGYIVLFRAFYPMPIYLSVLLATGPKGNGATNLYSQASNSVYANPNGAGFVHAIFSTAVFRNE